MSDFHPDISLVAGDDWVIEGTLLADDGSPLDLTNGTLSWRLLDSDGQAGHAQCHHHDRPAGDRRQDHDRRALYRHRWPDAGRLFDLLRADLTGGRSTLWSGRLLVSVNVFEPVLGY